jgi:serine/threonine protein kinase
MVALADKYVLGELIGSGGMGLVFAAEQLCLGRTVAVKLMRAEYAANAYMLRKFHTEAIAGSRLHHPNIVRVIDHGMALDGAPFLAMELVRGQLLSSLLVAEGSLAPRRAAKLAGQLLAGLATAHDAGIVHADIKTDNILVEDGDTERVKLIDFGLARLVDDPTPRSLLLSGTPEYLAPELILGELATTASDVYAAGVVLYELLTGEVPFSGATLGDVLDGHLSEDVIPPSLRNPDGCIPVEIERVVMRALAKDPSARFRDARAFGAALAVATPADDDASFHARSRPAFASETPTQSLPAVRPRPSEPPRRGARRLLRDAIERGDVAQIVAGYLDIARHLVDEQRLRAAAKQLEEGIDIITAGAGPSATDAPEPLWRLLLTLAAVYDGLGDRARARGAALAGQSHADRTSSPVGRERARALIVRLGHHAA